MVCICFSFHNARKKHNFTFYISGKLEYLFEDGHCQNPLTRETIVGVIPLTFDINVLCKSLCDIFCGGRKMPFVVFGFITALFGKYFRLFYKNIKM